MCGICGCAEGDKRIEDTADPHDHGHSHGRNHHDHAWGDGHTHPHAHPMPHSHSCSHDVEPVDARGLPDGARLLSVERDILVRNNSLAEENRRHFRAAGTLALNLVSSPGSGKTALLVETLRRVARRYPVAVIEGDQETSADADRIRATGAPAIQINTGKGCHLDAALVRGALARLSTPQNGALFIENVGNLVCPAGFDLGEAKKVVIVSVTEGEDKPLKYSAMFAAAGLMVVTKIDLLPHLDFDVARLIENARRVNPAIAVLQVSSRTGEGMDRWLDWLEAERAHAAAA